MSYFDFNLYFNAVLESDGTFSPAVSTTAGGRVSDPGTLSTLDAFESGERLTDQFGYSDFYVGSVEVDGVTYVVFGGGGTLQQGSTYFFRGVADDPASHTGPGTDFAASSISTDTFIVCFAAGTQIATPEGEAAVEALKIGDLVATADGRAVPVKWIGRQTVHKLFTPAERFAPVRVTAGALGNGLPHTDLVLTADHALILDGLAINAGALVNGTTIAYDPVASLPDRVTYYHVETADHDVILANGAAAETFVDYLSRRTFDNHAEYAALYGEERTIPEIDMPRVSSARLVPPAIRARLAGAKAA